MTTLLLRAKEPASVWSGLARIVIAVTTAFEAAFEVIDEATDQTAAARRRYPTAD